MMSPYKNAGDSVVTMYVGRMEEQVFYDATSGKKTASYKPNISI